jgi:tetratricopeptide (TPR) repeat protein
LALIVLALTGIVVQHSGQAERRPTALPTSLPTASAEGCAADWSALQQQGEWAAAQAALQTCLAQSPFDAVLTYRLGLLLAVLDPSASLPYLDRAAQLDPASRPAFTAIEDALQTSRLYDDPAYTALTIGRALAALGEWHLAAESFRRAIASDPTYGEAWAYLSEALQQLGQDGSREMAQALLLAPNSVAVNMLAALHWQRQGNLDQALAYLDAAARLEPHNPVIQAELGRLTAEQGDLPLAEAYYRQAIELAPADPAYLRLLAEFSLRYDIQLHEIALPAARQALLLNGQDPASLVLMAYVLLRLDDPLTAERFLLQALTVAPHDPAAHLHLGQVYWLRGQAERARQEWATVLNLAPGSAAAQEAARWLER